MPYVLVAIVAILAIITLVGHGIWLFFAAIFASRQGRTCPFCRRPIKRTDRCEHCHRVLKGHRATELDDLEAVERQLGRFRRNGNLKPAVVDQMLRRLHAYRQRLTAPAPMGQSVLAAEILPDAPRTRPVPIAPKRRRGGTRKLGPPCVRLRRRPKPCAPRRFRLRKRCTRWPHQPRSSPFHHRPRRRRRNNLRLPGRRNGVGRSSWPASWKRRISTGANWSADCWSSVARWPWLSAFGSISSRICTCSRSSSWPSRRPFSASACMPTIAGSSSQPDAAC